MCFVLCRMASRCPENRCGLEGNLPSCWCQRHGHTVLDKDWWQRSLLTSAVNARVWSQRATWEPVGLVSWAQPGQGEQRAGRMRESDFLLIGLMELEASFNLKSRDHHLVLSIAQPANPVMSTTFDESGHWSLPNQHQKC